jgi:hypothetical protein
MQVFLDQGALNPDLSTLEISDFSDSTLLSSHILSQNFLNADEYEVLVEGLPLSGYPFPELTFKTLTITPITIGSKGGFGSLLRNAAARKKHFTNFDSAKDMNGKRLRDIRNEKQLIEWLRKKKQERKYVDGELEEFKKQEKERVAKSSFLKIDKSYNDKVGKWVNTLNSSVRAGMKKRFLRKRNDQEALGDAQETMVCENDPQSLAPCKKLKSTFIDCEIAPKNQEQAAQRKNSSNGSTNGSDEVDNKENADADDGKGSDTEQNVIEPEIAAETIEEAPVIVYAEIILIEIESVEDLIALGVEHLKSELMRLGLKCGGKLEDRAQRLWDIKLNPSLLFDKKYIAKK